MRRGPQRLYIEFKKTGRKYEICGYEDKRKRDKVYLQMISHPKNPESFYTMSAHQSSVPAVSAVSLSELALISTMKKQPVSVQSCAAWRTRKAWRVH
jgi:hypothetical protein